MSLIIWDQKILLGGNSIQHSEIWPFQYSEEKEKEAEGISKIEDRVTDMRNTLGKE